jgi:hypothetical protein
VVETLGLDQELLSMTRIPIGRVKKGGGLFWGLLHFSELTFPYEISCLRMFWDSAPGHHSKKNQTRTLVYLCREPRVKQESGAPAPVVQASEIRELRFRARTGPEIRFSGLTRSLAL